MMQLMSRHTLFSVYLVVFAGLCYGVYLTSGTVYFGSLMLYFGTFAVLYLLLTWQWVTKNIFSRFGSGRLSTGGISIYWLIVPTLIVVIGHLVTLGGIPAFQAMELNYIEEVATFRNRIFDDKPAWIGYPTSIVLKSALPFLLLYALAKKKWTLYWIILLTGTLYTFGLMQKSFIVGFILPAMVLALLKKQFLIAVKLVAIIVVVVFSLVHIANPPGGSRPDPALVGTGPATEISPLLDPNQQYSRLELFAIGLADRLLVVPGRVVSDWFEVIPAKMPYLQGDGYRLLALIRGRSYHNYSKELYPLIQPEYAAMGLTGTVNAASFMYDYSNFGNTGMVLAGIMLAFLLAWLEHFFRQDFKLKLCLCMFPVLMLSSGALTTILFSGGFGFTILFYFFYLRNNQQA
ncbi:MAG: hypothetical protein HYZ14_14695 [Bacteroidetes bacterium]|nr:hypothetical protein [Bacteroidota bacterium]